jgi:hypothetical protein
LSVASLGRICVAGNSSSHTVKFVKASDGSDLSSAVVNMAGCTANQFVYAKLSSAVNLDANASYYLVSQEFQGSDSWYDYSQVGDRTEAVINGAIYLYNGTTWVPIGNQNDTYGPVNFTYSFAPTAPPVTPSGFVTGVALGGQSLRNDFAGWIGMKLTVGSAPLTLTSLGRYCVAGNSGSHVVKLVTASTGTDVPSASVAVNMNGCTAGQFQFAGLSSSVTLNAWTSYYLVSQEYSGGDRWYDFGRISVSADASVSNAIYSSGTNWISNGGANNSYGPPSFQYTLGSVPQGSPFVISFDQTRNLRNDFSGWVGMKLTTGGNSIAVSSLARICVAGNSGIHTVKFVDAATGTDVAGGAVQINTSGCTPGQFVYTALPTPITLGANAPYYLVTQESSGGDRWYDYGAIVTNSMATVNSAVYASSGPWMPIGATPLSYGPLNFK